MIILDFWFLTIVGLSILGGVYAAEIGSFVMGTVTFILGLTALQLVGHVPVWESIVSSPFSIVLYVILFFIAGSVFTLLWMWPEYLRGKANRINYAFDKFKKENPSKARADFFASDYYNEFHASSNKENLATWILTWPFALIWELAHKPAKYIWRFTWDVLGNAFERIGQFVVGRILNK